MQIKSSLLNVISLLKKGYFLKKQQFLLFIFLKNFL